MTILMVTTIDMNNTYDNDNSDTTNSADNGSNNNNYNDDNNKTYNSNTDTNNDIPIYVIHMCVMVDAEIWYSIYPHFEQFSPSNRGDSLLSILYAWYYCNIDMMCCHNTHNPPLLHYPCGRCDGNMDIAVYQTPEELGNINPNTESSYSWF